MITMELKLSTVKILVAVLMTGLTAIMGLIPIKIASCIRGKKKDKLSGSTEPLDDADAGNQRSDAIFCCLRCFGAGVLLATSFIHILPEVRESIHASQEGGALPHTEFPVTELCLCGGIVLVWIVDELGHCLMHRYTKKKTHDIHAIINTDTAGDTLRNLLLVLALSFHAIFEGLAIGLEESSTHVWYLFLAIAIHKLEVAFAMGLEMSSNNTKISLHVIYMLAFSLMSPIGTIIATFLTEELDPDDPFNMGILGVMQGIAAGTILYVCFFEILFKQVPKKTPAFLKILCLAIGFASMACVSGFLGHSHAHGNSLQGDHDSHDHHGSHGDWHGGHDHGDHGHDENERDRIVEYTKKYDDHDSHDGHNHDEHEHHDKHDYSHHEHDAHDHGHMETHEKDRGHTGHPHDGNRDHDNHGHNQHGSYSHGKRNDQPQEDMHSPEDHNHDHSDDGKHDGHHNQSDHSKHDKHLDHSDHGKHNGHHDHHQQLNDSHYNHDTREDHDDHHDHDHENDHDFSNNTTTIKPSNKSPGKVPSTIYKAGTTEPMTPAKDHDVTDHEIAITKQMVDSQDRQSSAPPEEETRTSWSTVLPHLVNTESASINHVAGENRTIRTSDTVDPLQTVPYETTVA